MADTVRITINKVPPEEADLNGVLADFQRSADVDAKKMTHKVCIAIRIGIIIVPLSCVGLGLTFDIVITVLAQSGIFLFGYQLTRIADTDTFIMSAL
jgi:hypothetical protein